MKKRRIFGLMGMLLAAGALSGCACGPYGMGYCGGYRGHGGYGYHGGYGDHGYDHGGHGDHGYDHGGHGDHGGYHGGSDHGY